MHIAQSFCCVVWFRTNKMMMTVLNDSDTIEPTSHCSDNVQVLCQSQEGRRFADFADLAPKIGCRGNVP